MSSYVHYREIIEFAQNVLYITQIEYLMTEKRSIFIKTLSDNYIHLCLGLYYLLLDEIDIQ